MWTYLGFEPWEHKEMQGVCRKITLIKSGLLGKVAEYYAWDYIVWRHQEKRDIEYLFKEWLPMSDVVTQRFMFVGTLWPRRKARSYCCGLKGFLEVYAYMPGEPYHPKIKDIVPPVDFALNPEKDNPVQRR